MRSAIVLAVAAAEVGFKQFAVKIFPDTAWILEHLQSPPLTKMLDLFLGAHAYYLKKHLRQFTQAGDLEGASEFLTPIAIGSRYISEQNPKDTKMFPSPPHIKKAINCFKETLPPYAVENYSYLSEFCHPNVLALMQYYDWIGPGVATFVDHKHPEGTFGPTVAAALKGLLAIDDLLLLAEEKIVRGWLHQLFDALAQQIK
jgi:hypothetical protein